MEEKKKLKELYKELKKLIILYDYALLYNKQIDEQQKEKQQEKGYVKKLVLKKKYYGKDLVVG